MADALAFCAGSIPGEIFDRLDDDQEKYNLFVDEIEKRLKGTDLEKELIVALSKTNELQKTELLKTVRPKIVKLIKDLANEKLEDL